MRYGFAEPSDAVAGDLRGLPIRFADGANVEDHGASIWVVTYVRRVIDGEIIFEPTEVIAFPRDGFMGSLLAAIKQMLPDGMILPPKLSS